MGANDGIVSTAGLVVAGAGATSSRTTILTAGLAGLLPGRSPCRREHASAGSQRDSERAMLALERRELAQSPRAEVAGLAGIYQSKGLQPGLARQVAEQLSARDSLAAHAEAHLAFTRSRWPVPAMPERASCPLPPGGGAAATGHHAGGGAGRIAATIIAMPAVLVATAAATAAPGQAPHGPAVVRNVTGAAITMGLTTASAN